MRALILIATLCINLGNSSNLQTEYAALVTDSASKMQFPFKLQYDVVGDKDSSVCQFLNTNDSETSNITVNMIDKLIFNGVNWISVKDGSRTIEPFQQQVVTAQKEEKNILGYSCKKYITTFKDGASAEIWVCKDLPETIMPAGGGKPLGGAILEWTLAERNISFKAVAIKRIIDLSPLLKD